MCKDKFIFEEWETEKLAELVESTKQFNAINRMKKERAEALAEGRAQGHAQGHAQGRAEGEAIGVAKGEAIGRKETAFNMLKENMDIELISKVTKLTKEELIEIKNTL